MPFKQRVLSLAFLGIWILSSCSLGLPMSNAPTPTPDERATELTPVQTMSPVSSPTATPVPRVLTVCLGQEPNSLYPFDVLNTAARSVLEAVYDGPIDTFTNGYQPVILEQIPSLKNGDAQLNPVTVKRGDMVVDASGQLVALDFGVSVLPAGCYDDACAVRFSSAGELKMDQVVATFRLLPDLKWSDGTPLTAKDSLYAFQLASDPATPGSKYLLDRTQSYEALDDFTVQWWGVPGFVDPTYADNFWSPLPEHVWGKLKPEELARADVATRPLLGWGAYTFTDWAAGEYIRFDKNPYYFRAEDGLPFFETLVFRFVKDAPTGISALIAGQCDILDSSVRLDGQIDLLTELERSNQVQLITSTTPVMERLDFGIRPAAFDDGVASNDRPDFFGDVRTRQGIAYCLDRARVVNTVLNGMSQVPDTFVSPSHTLFFPDTAKYPFDIAKGIDLLKRAGWTDPDNDPSTPMVAGNVKGVPAGTPLVLRYWTTSALQRQQVSAILAESLAQCGVGVQLEYFTQDSFYAPGPDGPLFGRQFDLAEYAVAAVGGEPTCSWLMDNQIPRASNRWLGLNVSGYLNPDFDLLCRKALRTLPDQPEHASTYTQAQTIFANDLPFIPLYMRIKVAVARRDLCNLRLDPFTMNDLWNLEDLDYKPLCE
ncbi:MAG: peptide ABC transporter substrate-binding protein [Anaerolineales bacterium]